MKQSTAKAMLAAQKRAMQTPEEVRSAFLAKRYSVHGLDLEPWSIAILLLLEELQHPLVQTAEVLTDDKDGKPVPMLDELTGEPMKDKKGKPIYQRKPVPVTTLDVVRAIFIFADSEAAYDAMQGGPEVFDCEARKFIRSLPPLTVREADAMIPQIIAEGLATLPGAGTENPPPAS